MKSLWSDKNTLPSFEVLSGDTDTDVLIVGGGIAGILCAYYLERSGVDYILVEANTVCGGITKNTTAKITSQHGLIYHKLLSRFGAECAKLYLTANEDAVRQYRTLCRDIDCAFETRDSFVYSIDGRKKIEKELDALSKIGYKAQFCDSLPLPLNIAGAVCFKDQAQFDPLRFIAAVSKDLNIRERTKVREFVGNTAITDKGKIRAKKIIIATHFPILNKHGAYFLKMYQHRSYVLALKGVDDVGGMYVDEADTGLSFRSAYGSLLLGGGSHRTGKRGGGWRELEDFAQRNYPDAQIAYRWATQDCMTLDGIAYVGQYSDATPDLLVSTGFNKWGMTSSLVAARILTDRILGKKNEYESLFAASRSILRPQLALNVAESLCGLIRPTAPRCPHMGCALQWNSQERTWDCSCHGSRFSEDGELIDGPATDDLKKKPSR